ncbi:MAG: hypothetical protein CMM52_17550 [Rhodospirillaceae bacterium]|nr:hypothetical protein [Rhodospirillaceae bacterium]|tara:strand:+ start:102811 stop:103446 length:636 start_codon:yes stop_codon:yes gene_type:complete
MTGPRLVAYIAMQPGDSTIISLGRGEDVSAQKISKAIRGRRASLKWFERGRTHLEISGLYLFLADNPKFKPALRKSFLDKSIEAFDKGLVLEPRKPYSWVQFAQAKFRQDRRSKEINSLLRMSYMIAPEEPRIVVTRVQLGFRAQNILAKDLEKNFRNDIRLNLKHQPRQLTIFARKKFALPWLNRIAKGDSKLTDNLYREFLKLPPPGDL